MKEIIVATSNENKVKEFNSILKPLGYKCISLKDLNFNEEIEETGTTFKENAFIKASKLHSLTNKPVIADDSGLCCDGLNGEPGIYSARYKNLSSFSEKMDYILKHLKTNRNAHFNCTICYVDGNEVLYFEGILNGVITEEKTGTNGFGYDPIFIPEGYKETLANLSFDKKNEISHRRKAIMKLVDYISSK